MATQLTDKPAGKHEAFIETQLARAERRIRLIDLSAALLGFVAGSLLYLAALMLLDRSFELSRATRQLSLLFYLVAAGVYLAYTVVRPLMWKVNPHYAARRLEDTLESDRNHVVNWLDLRDQKLPAVIKSSLGRRAAKDLSGTDPDRAIEATRLYAGGIATALAVILLVVLFFAFGATIFRALLGRAFAPFGSTGGVPRRTQVSILKPQGGDAVVTIGNPVTIVAHVGGRVPGARAKDAPCLLYRHDPSEPYRQRYLQADESGGEWAATVAPADVGNGFTYKVTAGDAETAEYRVTVRAAPLVSDFLATYRHRKYTDKPDRTSTDRKIEGLQGTEVTLAVRTNRTVASGGLLFDKDSVPLASQPVEGDPQSMRFRLTLKQSDAYRIEFTTVEGEKYTDPVSYDLVVTPDNPPAVTITEPARDVELPADGHLEIKGEVSDDLGVAKVALLLSLNGKPIKTRFYLADKLGKPGYGTPVFVEYRHLLELPTLLDEAGKPVELKPGAVIEYQLLAADACDFREPAVETRSEPKYKITIADTKKDDAKLKKDREEAKKRQKEHEKKQDDRLKDEKQKREKQKEKEEEQEKQESEKRDQEKKKAGGKEDDEKKNEGGDGKKKDDQGKGERDKETAKQADQLQKEMDKEKQDKGEGKGAGDKDDKTKQGEGKGAGDKDGKEGGKPGEGAGGQDSKGKGSEAKPGQPGNNQGNNQGNRGSEGRDPPKPEAGKAGESKDDSKGPPGKEKGERKPTDGPRPGDNVRDGKGKPSDTEGKPQEDAKPGQDRPKPDVKPGESKDGKQGSDVKKGENGGKAGESKPPPKDKQGGAPGESKGRPDPKDATPDDVKKAADDLAKGTPKQRQQAAKDLEDMANKGKDETRGAAKKAIDDAKNKGDLDKDGKAPPKPGDKGEEGEDGQGSGKPGENSQKTDEQGEGQPGKAKGREDTPKGSNPGEGGEKGRTDPGTGSGGDDLPAKNQRPEKHRASQMQLEKFKKVDQATLDRLKMSRQQYEKFLRDYADLAKRQEADKGVPEKLSDPSKGGTLPSMRGKTIEPTGSGDGVKNEGRPKPPPGYRDAFNDLIRRLNEPKRGPKD